MTLEILKGYGTFKENGIYFTTDGTGKSIDLIFEYEADETAAANGEKVKLVKNIETNIYEEINFLKHILAKLNRILQIFYK